MIQAAVVQKLPLRDRNGIMNPNYRMHCLCGKVSNIASNDDAFAERARSEHVRHHQFMAMPITDPFEGL